MTAASDPFPAFTDLGWEEFLFMDTVAPEVGQRLGIHYVRTLQPSICIKIGEHELQLHQEAMGMMAISGVIWDAGLFISDFLWQMSQQQMSQHKVIGSIRGGKVLDIGCGTGVAGICSLAMGADLVVFTDIERLSCFDFNIEQLPPDWQQRVLFEVYKWNEEHIPKIFCASNTDGLSAPIVWDTVLCSDLLYESKHHTALLSVLRRLQCKRIIFSYKKRHDEPEREFFRALSVWCTVRVVDSACIQLVNLSKSALIGLYIIVAEPFVQSDSLT